MAGVSQRVIVAVEVKTIIAAGAMSDEIEAFDVSDMSFSCRSRWPVPPDYGPVPNRKGAYRPIQGRTTRSSV